MEAAEQQETSADPMPPSELATFLQALVRIPSVNPPGNERPVAEFLARKLEALGFETSIFESAPGRANLVARRRGTGGGPVLILNGHTDVQPAASGWQRDPFGGEIEGDRLYGRGSIDMKAGLAAAVFAIESLIRRGVPLAGDLVFAAVADEVSGGHMGTGFLMREGMLKGDFAIVCEPTGEQVNVAHRGALWLEIEVTGKSAHGGRPWLGVNAVSKAAKIVRAIEEDLLPRLQSRTHPMLPAPTINFGGISGGTKFNLVADRCVLQIDRRLVPGETVAACLSEFEDVCAAVHASDSEPFGVRVSEVMSVPPGEIAADAPIVTECQRAYREVTGREAGIGCTAGFEDAHFFLNAGIPTAMFGPYRRNPTGAKFHTSSGGPDEHVQISLVEEAARIYARLIENLTGPEAGGMAGPGSGMVAEAGR